MLGFFNVAVCHARVSPSGRGERPGTVLRGEGERHKKVGSQNQYIAATQCPLGHSIRPVIRIFPFYRGIRKNFFNKKLLRCVGVTAVTILLISCSPLPAQAALGIESGGMRIYSSIVSLGKWVIIIKGSIDCIQSVLAGDFQSAKKQFFGYLMCFAIMLGLPWAMNEIEVMFK